MIDPYAAGDFGGRVALSPLSDNAELTIATHLHRDHAAFEAVPSARVIAAPFDDGELRIDALTAAHDEFGGRLRGGLTQILCVRVARTRIAFCGDLGERPVGTLLNQLVDFAPDVLVVPVGGYFTLEADGAAELVALLKPAVAVPCHSGDDGTRFAELAPRQLFTRRFVNCTERDALDLPVTPYERGTVVVTLRPLNAR